MTNKQWLIKEIQSMSDEEFNQMEFQKLKNEEMGCGRKNCVYRDCDKCELDWLQQEHKEPIKLSDAERVVLENVDKVYKWIVRDDNGQLKIYTQKPKKDIVNWLWNIEFTKLNAFNHLFQFIKWEDTEPYNIEELLK